MYDCVSVSVCFAQKDKTTLTVMVLMENESRELNIVMLIMLPIASQFRCGGIVLNDIIFCPTETKACAPVNMR